jgi:WD40 repeat protein/DNA-binding SARP family transcriptional activator
MAGLYLSLLGPISLTLDDRPIEKFQTKRAQGLLIYLAVEQALGTQSHNREVLVELLWPGVTPDSGRSSLRQTLYLLRRTIEELAPSQEDGQVPLLLTDRTAVRINPDYPLSSDVADFSQLLDDSRKQRTEAISLYRGEFLADFYLPDTNPFEEWAAARREAFRRQALEALAELTADLIGKGEYLEAEQYGRRQIEIDNLRESAYRQLMQLLAWSGRRPQALSLYQELVDILDDEFGTLPGEATTALYEAIREQRLAPPAKSPAAIVPQPLLQNPYRGLYAFREEDAPFFFGRETFTDRLIAAAWKQPLVVVIGPSGSGKSSVVSAGLIAHLRQEEGWSIIKFRPGKDPFQALAVALLPLLDPQLSETDLLVESRKMAVALSEAMLPLRDVLARILSKSQQTNRLLLVGNQFEELYTAGIDEGIHYRFLDSMLLAIEEQRSRAEPKLTVVLSMRADFLGQALAYRPFADALQDSDLKLGPMTRAELARAIEMPAGKQGISFEAGLLDRILEDVGAEPGKLPLLQFALTALWEQRTDGLISHVAYDEIGGVKGALTYYADEVYEALDPDAQEGARLSFLQMVHPGQQTEDTRRIAHRSDLGETEWEVVQRLANARLVVTGRNPAGQETAELAHEALIQGWVRLNDWIEDNRAFRTWQERLRASLRQWQASEHDESALLRGVPLSEAEGWLGERAEQLSQDERVFIKASLAYRDERQIEQERARAARERLRRQIIIGLVSVLVVVIALGLLAVIQWRQAERASALAQNALSRQLALLARNSLDEELVLAHLLSAEAFLHADTFEARNSLLSAISYAPQLTRFLHGQSGGVRKVAFSPDGRLLATGSGEGAIQLWDIATGQPLGEPIMAHERIIVALSFVNNGHLLATAGFDDTVHLWEVKSSGSNEAGLIDSPLHTLQIKDLSSLAFNPSGSLIASGGIDGSISLWDMEEGSASFGQALTSPIEVHEGNTSSVAFSPEGQFLATGSSEGTVILLDVQAALKNDIIVPPWKVLEPAGEGHRSNVTSLAFSPDGQTLASGSFDGTVILWDVTTGQQIGPPLTGHDGWVTGVAFSSDGRTLASSGQDKKVLIWDIEARLEGNAEQPLVNTLAGHLDAVLDISFSPNGQILASGGADQVTALWDLAIEHPLARQIGGDEPLNEGSFSPDGKFLVSAGGQDNEKIILWDMVEGSPAFGQPISQLLTGQKDIAHIELSPDGTIIASGANDGSIAFWDLAADEPIGVPLDGHDQRVRELAFSPDTSLRKR